ncbi:MAG: HlyC/CorC family transporter [Bdellovibrionales bacterium]|nr:HlyC/CorC family transporter [Bdellovibrionales bacterium]
MTSMYDPFGIIFLCLILEAFFSGSEMAMVSINRAQLKYLVEKGSGRAKSIMRALDNPEWFLGTTLLGTNLAVLTLNAYATYYVIETFGPKYELLTMLFTAPLILFLGEAIPKALFQRYADVFAVRVIYPLKVISWLFSPLVAIFVGVSKLAIQSSRLQIKKKTPFLSREELELLFQASEKQKGFKEVERRMIDRVFSFSKKPAREIMIPLVDVVSLREDATLDEATKLIKQNGFSRYPVYSFRVDHVVGWINHFDLLRVKNMQEPIRPFIREIRFFPQTVFLGKLLLEMQKSGDRIVMLVDEYGGVVGMVTLEDVIEEVVGEIEDEYDYKTSFIKKMDLKSAVVNARIPIATVNEMLPIKIPLGDYETLAGYLLAHIQRIPMPGEIVKVEKIHFRVLKSNNRAIEEVEIVL